MMVMFIELSKKIWLDFYTRQIQINMLGYTEEVSHFSPVIFPMGNPLRLGNRFGTFFWVGS